MNLQKLGKLTICAIIFEIIFYTFVIVAFAEGFDYNRIADAIYWTEGDVKAHTPFGIESVTCKDYNDCRKVCINTIRNNERRWQGSKENDFLRFLAKRYCPYNWEVWLKNVKYYVAKPKKI